MAKAKYLTAYERGKIDAYRSSGKTYQEISALIKRSTTAIYNYIHKGQNYGKLTKAGRKKILSKRTVRRIYGLLSNKSASIRKIKGEMDLSASASTIWRAVNKSNHLVHKKKKAKPPLNQTHKKARMNFAEKYMTFDKKWDTVVFSDDKKFNLDGPDGWSYYWHDLRKEDELFSKRQFGGGSVITWGGFSSAGKTPLVFIDGILNSTKYVQLLEKNLVPSVFKLAGKDWIFQQDNAPIHVSKVSKKWFSKKKINLLDWPAYSPDLNPMENIWGILARKVYANGRQFYDKESLKNEIIKCWNSISAKELKNLTNSMNNRIFKLIKANGGSIDY